jgi:putative ABC transport system permease protein
MRALAPPDLRDPLLDDFDEAFAKRAGADAAAARRWSRRQALSSIAPLLAMRARARRRMRPAERHSLTMSTLLHDLRYALRLLRRSPGFALAAIATIALAIGANTAIFSVVHGLLLKPLPYPDPDRLVMVWQDLRSRGGPPDEWATPGNFADWREERDTFAGVAAIAGWGPTLTGVGDPEPLPGEQVTPAYFDVLGLPPAAGRAFREEEALPAAPRVVMLGYDFWQRRFGGEPGVIGRTIVLGGEPHEVVGVAAAGLAPIVTQKADVWRPLRLNLASPSRGAVVLRVVARLQPDVRVDRANAAMGALARRLESQYPEFNTGVGFSVTALHDRVVGPARAGLLVLTGAVALVLLVGCVNIANLLLARSSARVREMAVRAALGAGRARVIRQLLTESLLLAALGGACGVAVAYWGVQVLVAIVPAGTPRLDAVAVDPLVLVFAAGLTLLTGVLFGLAPALQLSRREQGSTLKDGGRGTSSAGGQRVRRVLIVAEIATALVLLVGGGLLLRSFLALQRVDLGFDPANRLVAFVPLAPAKYRTAEARTVIRDRLLERLSSLPGVDRAALTSVAPLDLGDSDMGFRIDGTATPKPGEDGPGTWYRIVSAGYFETMGIRLIDGRAFADREAAPVVVVNETLARRYFPGERAVGRRVRFASDGPWFTIVGVAADVKQRGARGGDRVQTFIPYWHLPELGGGTTVVLQTTAAPASLVPALARAVRDVDSDAPITRAAPMAARVAGSVEEPRFLARMTGVFAVAALLLAAIGVYGVMSMTVAQRLPELGVRLALGARPADVFRLVFTDGLRLAALGLAAGAGAAVLLAPALDAVLFEVAPRDPWTIAATAALLLVVAAAATFLPARRATAVDPVQTLRE